MAQDNGIGELFQSFGERYIHSYKPDRQQIKLIRSIRICKTPALGGKVYTCKACDHKKYVYFGCGNSRCPKCQGVKRMQWQDKLAKKILKCPYQHITFTMPQLLNTLARNHSTIIYNCIMRSAWSSLKECSEKQSNLGALPGAIMVLHTFGSDLKYHVHVHALVTFGGIDANGHWQWPTRKRKIVPFREMRNTFRDHFLHYLQAEYDKLHQRLPFEELEDLLKQKSWNVHAEPPTTNTKVIEEYLGRYICRIGLSKNKFHYDNVHKKVTLAFKDYRNKNRKTGEVPLNTKILEPLLAINQMMQHCLPPYFQKSRYYGLHASSTIKKNKDKLPAQIKNNDQSIRTVFQIIKAMLGLEALACENCGQQEFKETILRPDKDWIKQYISIPNYNIRGSPNRLPHIPPNYSNTVLCSKANAMYKNSKISDF